MGLIAKLGLAPFQTRRANLLKRIALLPCTELIHTSLLLYLIDTY